MQRPALGCRILILGFWNRSVRHDYRNTSRCAPGEQSSSSEPKPAALSQSLQPDRKSRFAAIGHKKVDGKGSILSYVYATNCPKR